MDLAELMARAHDVSDDDLYEWVEAEWERRQEGLYGDVDVEDGWTEDDEAVAEWLAAEAVWQNDVQAWLDAEQAHTPDVPTEPTIYPPDESDAPSAAGDNGLPYEQIAMSPDRLTDGEQAQIESYALGGHKRMNEALRGDIEMTPEIQRGVDLLHGALDKYPLTKAVRVTRSVPPIAVDFDAEHPATILGEAIDFAEFLSTSMRKYPPPRRGDVILDLIVPAGTPAFALGSLAEFPLESELLVIDARTVVFIAVAFDEEKQKWRLYGAVKKPEDS